MKKAALWALGKSDFVKGGILLILQTLIGSLTLFTVNFIKFHDLPTAIQWQALGASLVLTFLTYLSKNIGTNSQDQFAKKEPDMKIEK